MASSGSGYDVSANSFSPDGRIFQVEYAQKAVSIHAGLALGMVCQDGVVMGVQKPLVQKLLVPTFSQRIHTIASNMGMGITGFHPDARQLVHQAREDAADFVPLLSEIVSAAMQAQFETDMEAQKSSRLTKRIPVNSPSSVSRETFALSGDVDPTDLPSEFSQGRGALRTEDITPSDSQISLFDFDAECPRCHLRVHQHDARFCRNCAAPLRKKMFDD